ncbi:hypothetical protein [Acutalibacter caecimuris]|uniref:hypothetical protein n=1 Tax=Acutalibacter caecimuris TaxID=3093657 RepID=UPI002AC8DA31|nr:hypothetical protein [Acutalibacter sp. M00118]
MERKLKGIAILLFSILLTLGFQVMGIGGFTFAFFDIWWAGVFILLGAVGLAMALWPER